MEMTALAKPTTLPVLAMNIPLELKVLHQWVGWHWEYREHEKKWTKPPVCIATMGRAATNKPDTWSFFDEAMACYNADKVDGVGFVFTSEDPYCGIDFDHVRDTNNNSIEPWVLEHVYRLDSYTEISPTGEGLHVIVKGNLPYGRRKQGKVEMYDRGRFFTVTGALLEFKQ